MKASLSELDNPEPSPGPDSLIQIWLDRAIALAGSRGPSESYSDVILRQPKAGA